MWIKYKTTIIISFVYLFQFKHSKPYSSTHTHTDTKQEWTQNFLDNLHYYVIIIIISTTYSNWSLQCMPSCYTREWHLDNQEKLESRQSTFCALAQIIVDAMEYSKQQARTNEQQQHSNLFHFSCSALKPCQFSLYSLLWLLLLLLLWNVNMVSPLTRRLVSWRIIFIHAQNIVLFCILFRSAVMQYFVCLFSPVQ